MSYKVRTIPNFEKSLKRLVKKFPSLKAEFIALVDSLEENPEQGTAIGNSCYKIRLAITSKGKGKSGGARVIIHVVITDKIVFLLDIYDKSEQANISDKELSLLLKWIASWIALPIAGFRSKGNIEDFPLMQKLIGSCYNLFD